MGILCGMLVVKSDAGKTLELIKESHPEVYPNLINYRFPGREQRLPLLM